MLRTLFVHCLAVTSILLLSHNSAFSLQCPEAPKQTNKDWDVEVKATIAKIGPVKGGDLQTHTKNVTQDLLARLPNADKIYMEQMMFAAFCSALRDDKTLKESEKAQRLKEYRDGVQQAIKDPSPKHKPKPIPIPIKTQDSGTILEKKTPASLPTIPVVEAKVLGVDDKLRIRVNGKLVHEGGPKDWTALDLDFGKNTVEIEVFNQASYTGGIEAFGGHKQEGWSYSVTFRHGKNEWPYSGNENEPPPVRFGTWFTVQNLELTVDSKTSEVSMRKQ